MLTVDIMDGRQSELCGSWQVERKHRSSEWKRMVQGWGTGVGTGVPGVGVHEYGDTGVLGGTGWGTGVPGVQEVQGVRGTGLGYGSTWGTGSMGYGVGVWEYRGVHGVQGVQGMGLGVTGVPGGRGGAWGLGGGYGGRVMRGEGMGVGGTGWGMRVGGRRVEGT